VDGSALMISAVGAAELVICSVEAVLQVFQAEDLI